MMRFGTYLLLAGLSFNTAAAQVSDVTDIDVTGDSDQETSSTVFTLEDAIASGERAVSATPVQEKCITIMNGFPDNGHEPRYQFFKLTQALTGDVNSTVRAAIDFYGDSFITPETPVVEVIENIANPVYRQAAPEITIGNMGYLIDFALDCENYLDGQIKSLEAFDPNLAQADFQVVIGEDALFMRQILSDSFYKLGGQDHEIFGPAIREYADALILARDAVEFADFDGQMANIEAMFLTDLDGRLARSNDVINNEMDRDALAEALSETEDLNEQAEMKSKAKMLQTLVRIMGGY